MTIPPLVIPIRRFATQEIADLAARMRAIDVHPAMGERLDAVTRVASPDFEAQSCTGWLRARALELAWIDRSIAAYPDARALGRGGNRREALRLAREVDAITIRRNDRPAAHIHAEVARGLLEHVSGVVGVLETVVSVSGVRT